MAIEQWVNLPSQESKKGTFVEGKIDKAKRVGPKLKVKVEFKKDSLATFKWKVTQTGGPAYTSKERGNNTRFVGHWRAATTNWGLKKVDDAIDVTLPVAGGAKYKVEVKYKDKLIGTKELESRRRIYYRPFKMKGLKVSDGDVASILDDMKKRLWTDSKDYYIDAIQKGETEIAAIPTIDSGARKGPSSSWRVTVLTKMAYGDLRDYEPVGIPVVIGRTCARKTLKTFYKEVVLPSPTRLDSPINETIEVTTRDRTGTHYLWKDLVPDDDKANRGRGIWFESAKILVSVTKNIHHTSSVSRKQAFAVGGNAGSWGGQSKVRLFADGKFLKSHAGKKALVELKVRTVSGFYNGYSSNTVNLITLMTEAFWSKRTVAGMKQTLLHEIGHKIGMVADGKAGSPDKPSKSHFYGGKGVKQYGHTGRHCKNGMTYSKSKWKGTPKCVMFGASHKKRPGDFCDACAKVVPKLDVSGDYFEKPVRQA